MLTIFNLHARVDDKEILRGINLKVNAGVVHAIMGPNGSGKSTLAYTIMGHPAYEVEVGSKIEFEDENILEMSVDKRADKGIFLSFQNNSRKI